MNDLTDFLLARIAEDEASARAVDGGWQWISELSPRESDPAWMKNGHAAMNAYAARHDPAHVLAECEAKRRIVELHKAWPVLVERPPTMEAVDSGDPTRLAYRMSRQIQWQTEQEYRERFGHEPPTAPILRALALPYADHPDYREEWRP